MGYVDIRLTTNVTQTPMCIYNVRNASRFLQQQNQLHVYENRLLLNFTKYHKEEVRSIGLFQYRLVTYNYCQS